MHSRRRWARRWTRRRNRQCTRQWARQWAGQWAGQWARQWKRQWGTAGDDDAGAPGAGDHAIHKRSVRQRPNPVDSGCTCCRCCTPRLLVSVGGASRIREALDCVGGEAAANSTTPIAGLDVGAHAIVCSEVHQGSHNKFTVVGEQRAVGAAIALCFSQAAAVRLLYAALEPPPGVGQGGVANLGGARACSRDNNAKCMRLTW